MNRIRQKGLPFFRRAGKTTALLLTAALLILGGRQGALFAKAKKDSPAAQAEPESALYWRLSRENNAAFIIDGEGNKVPLKEYRRIIVISPGAVEVLYLIGAESAIAAITSGRDPIWPEEKTALLPTVGNTARPSLESIIALNPDLVIGNGMTAALMADLAGRGYAVLIHNAESLADIFNSTVLLGMLSGKEAEARILAEEKEAELEALKGQLKNQPLKLKGAFLYSANPIMAFPDHSLPGEILQILGVENIADGLNAAQPILSPEYILAQNPDFFFGAMSISKPEDILAADSVIAKTRAGMEKNISIVPSALLLRTSPRIVDTLLELYEEIKGYSR
jgi:iron complex transport system substrate-binding protein